jgi:cytochrome o ubiquinol oxidase subunit IV
MTNHIQQHDDHSHGSVKSYTIGFILSIIFTIIPFYMIMHHTSSSTVLISVAVFCAILQLLIQLVCFLHLNTESSPRWNLTAFMFTVLIVAILVIGSLWIMYNLNYNMMH